MTDAPGRTRTCDLRFRSATPAPTQVQQDAITSTRLIPVGSASEWPDMASDQHPGERLWAPGGGTCSGTRREDGEHVVPRRRMQQRAQRAFVAVALGLLVAAPVAAAGPATAAQLREQLRKERVKHAEVRAELRRANAHIRHDVQEAITIASLVSGVPRSLVSKVVRCESTFQPFVVNHIGATGLVQYMPRTWRATTFGKAGLSALSPYANVIQGALAMRHSMQPWAASRHCWGR